ncbi:MAG TPA: bifunctional 3-deoxy-7-phosphoheptulonate synthase/chorismate mutase [Pseudobacteroides sp.]|uniref:bifunctional 3-deoxy-7-phosphoheptulonate synthase/chorismate mutase n=1 Tax=Pseudobacteroides sp. TaxID=1968840 RepID=UPI002F95DE8F
MVKSIKELRQEIDSVNIEIMSLLNKRASLVKEISELKDGTNYFDPVRENEMMEMILKLNKGPLYNDILKDIFSSIFAASLRFMGVTRERKLLISSSNESGFLNIRDIFSLQTQEPVIIAGPCAVEKTEYLEIIAKHLKNRAIKFLRGGAFKPRSSPYEFQGLREEGLKILSYIGKTYDLITITEVVDTRDVEMVACYADVLQIGARNMQNFELLKEAGQTQKPILLKRGMNATIQEFMYAAEYIGLQGNRKLIMCERGIRTFETKTRNTLDISSIPIIKSETSLPILVDLSHSLGRKDIVNQIAKAVLAAGADGVMVEVHPYPEIALSDSKQQLTPLEFDRMLDILKA